MQVKDYIEMTAGVVGGKPRIAGRRISVQNIVVWHERLGKTADEIATEYNLSLAEIYAALAYYYDNREAIDASIRSDDEFIQKMQEELLQNA